MPTIRLKPGESIKIEAITPLFIHWDGERRGEVFALPPNYRIEKSTGAVIETNISDEGLKEK